jgi:DNA-binding FrmR family transcriptional regulator
MPESTYKITASMDGANSVLAQIKSMRAEMDKTRDAILTDHKKTDDALKKSSRLKAEADKAAQSQGKGNQKANDDAIKNQIRGWRSLLDAQTQVIQELQRVNSQSLKKQEEDNKKSLDKRESDHGKFLKRLKEMPAHVFEGAEHAKKIVGFGKEQFESLEPFIDAAKEQAQARLRFRSLNLSEADNERAFAGVEQMTKNFKGSTLTEGIETLGDLTDAVGGLDHALELLDTASKFRFTFSTVFAGMFKEDQMNEQIKAVGNILKWSGAIEHGVEAAKAQVDVIQQIAASTNGEVDPQKLYKALLKAGPGMHTLSARGIMEMVAPIGEFGSPEDAGTSLAAMNRVISQGDMGGKSYSAEWKKLGLVDRKGSNKLAGDFVTDPMKAMEMLSEAMKKHGIKFDYDEKGNLKESSKSDVVKEINKLFSTADAQRGAALFLTKPGTVDEGVEKAQGAPGVQTAALKAEQTEMGKLKEYEAAVKNFQINVGMPLLKAGADLAQAWTPFLSKLAKFPEYILAAVAAWKGGMALFQTQKYLKEAGVQDSIRKALGRGEGVIEKVSGGTGSAGREMFEALFKKEEAEVAGRSAGRAAGDGMAGGLIGGVAKRGSEIGQTIEEGVQRGEGRAEKAGRLLGTGIGGAIIQSVGIALASFAIEKIIQGWAEKADVAAKGEQASKDLGVLEKQRAQQEEARRRFTVVPGLPSLEELDKQIGAARVAQGQYGLKTSGMLEFGADSEFGFNIKALDQGPMGIFTGNVGALHYARTAGASPDDSVWETLEGLGGRRESVVKELQGEHLESADQLRGFLDALKATGKYSETEMGIVEKLAYQAYPDFAAQLSNTDDLARKATGSVTDFASAMAAIGTIKPPDWWPKTPPPSAPGGQPPDHDHADGGIATSRHFIGEAGPEAILPLRRIHEFLPPAVITPLHQLMPAHVAGVAHRVGAGAGDVHVHQGDVHIHGNASTETVSELRAVLRQNAHEIARELDPHIRRNLDDKMRDYAQLG